MYAPSSAASYFEAPGGAQVTVAASSPPAVPSHSMVGITMDVGGSPLVSSAGAYLIHGGMDGARHSLAHTARSSPATVCTGQAHRVDRARLAAAAAGMVSRRRPSGLGRASPRADRPWDPGSSAGLPGPQLVIGKKRGTLQATGSRENGHEKASPCWWLCRCGFLAVTTVTVVPLSWSALSLAKLPEGGALESTCALSPARPAGATACC